MSIRPRQAVVIFHGIGEQRPLDTLFGFTRPYDQPPNASGPPYNGIIGPDEAIYGEPFDLGVRYDQRRIKVTWNHEEQGRKLADKLDGTTMLSRDACTDFYEFYWAPAFRNTAWKHLWSWLVPLVLRNRGLLTSPQLAGPHRRFVHFIPYLLGLLAVSAGVVASLSSSFTATVFLGVFAGLVTTSAIALASTLGLLTLVRTILANGAAWAAFLVVWAFAIGSNVLEVLAGIGGSALVSVVTAWLADKVLSYLGDAARYLNNTPDNVEEVQKIREQAVAFLHALHEQRDEDGTGRPRYERIVVVGHSLGSVVAYDALRNLWARYHKNFKFSTDVDSHSLQILSSVENASWGRTDSSVAEPQRPDHSPDSYAATPEDDRTPRAVRTTPILNNDQRLTLQSAQYALYEYLRDAAYSSEVEVRRPAGSLPTRWLISDFVTIGSPLAHADLLLAAGAQQLRDKIIERLLVSNPPQFQRSVEGSPRLRYRVFRRSTPAGETGEHFVLHHAAPFAATRWTNLYFPHDLVGGPVAEHFGSGVEDLNLLEGKSSWPGLFLFRFPHTSYWKVPRSDYNKPGSKTSRERLCKLITRHPCVILRTECELLPEAVLRIREFLVGKNERGMSDELGSTILEFRYLCGPPGANPFPRWIGRDPVISLSRLPELRRALTELEVKAWLYVAISPDVRPVSDRRKQQACGGAVRRP